MRRPTRSCGRRRWSWKSARWNRDQGWGLAPSRNRRSPTMPELHDLIVRPVVTEKSSAAYGARKEYAFRVHSDATKPQIKAAIETLFKVSVTGVRTMVMRAKRRTYGRYAGRRPSWKKAIVTSKRATLLRCSRAKWASDSFGR